MTADNLILEHLRVIRAQLERTETKIDDLSSRMLATEQHVLALHMDMHALSSRLSKVDGRLDRIDRRLGLADEVLP